MVQNELALKIMVDIQFNQYQLQLQLKRIQVIITMMVATTKNLYYLNVEMPYQELQFK
jgi:hypothetical protein